MKIELPHPSFPMVTRVISNELFPPQPGDTNHRPGQPVTWAVSLPHPFIQKPVMSIVRMHIVEAGVEIYSLSEDGQSAMRNLIPLHNIRFIEEAMPTDVFIEELEAAEEEGAPGDDGGDNDPPEDEPASVRQLAPSPNGQA